MRQPSRPPTDDSVPRLVVALADRLRRAGVTVGSAEVITAQRSLLLLDLADREAVTAAIRACLAHSPRDREILDRVVGRWAFGAFGERAGTASARVDESRPAATPAPGASSEGGRASAGSWSTQHGLRGLDFADMDEEERRAAARFLEELGRVPPVRPARRRRAAHLGGRLDVGATIRRGRRFEGEPLELQWRRRGSVPVPINMILDVSASMEPYAVMLLHYLRAGVATQRASEAFVFGTKARRVTSQLRSSSAREPLAALAKEPPEWGGGTRIGAALGEINRNRCFRRGAIAVIASDGWDRGELDRLESEMRVLRERSRAVIWLSPHSERAGFEPTVGGLRTALPFVDVLLSAGSIDSLTRFSVVLREVGRRRSRTSRGRGATEGGSPARSTNPIAASQGG